MSLIPTAEFYSQAPEEISSSEVTRSDPHAQRLARLQWELVTRKELNQEVEEREVERDKVELVIRIVLCSAPSVPQPVVQSRRRPLLGPSPG